MLSSELVTFKEPELRVLQPRSQCGLRLLAEWLRLPGREASTTSTKNGPNTKNTMFTSWKLNIKKTKSPFSA